MDTTDKQDNADFNFFEICGYWAVDIPTALTLTPYEFFKYIEGKRKRYEDDFKQQEIIAWLNNALSRTRRLPSIDELTNGKQEKNKKDYVVARSEYEELKTMLNSP